MLNMPRRIKNTVMSAAAFAAFGLMVASPAAHANEIKSAMKEMKGAAKAAMSSSTIEEFAQYASRLQSGASHASAQTFSDDPATYREGMSALQQGINEMNSAIRSGDLDGAKEALRSIRSIEKRYHNAVGE